MKILAAVIILLIALGSISNEFHISFGVLFAITVVVIFALAYLIPRKTSDQIKKEALQARKSEIDRRESEMEIDYKKKIGILKALIKEKTGFDVNPNSDEIEIDGIIYSLTGNPDGWIIPWALMGRFDCPACGNPRIVIKKPADYGALVDKYAKHKNHG
ncbi:MAG: hypothetical protein OEZ31_11140 [Nitrospirota bacterium]|nr:hypothetical protein [Nitrospirota bacterium]